MIWLLIAYLLVAATAFGFNLGVGYTFNVLHKGRFDLGLLMTFFIVSFFWPIMLFLLVKWIFWGE
jgi:hypothetical protein